MINFFYILLFVFSAPYFLSGQITYYDDNDSIITEHEFQKKEKSLSYFAVPGDSLNQKKLIFRNQEGKINNRSLLIAFLNQELKLALDTSKLLVIIYYPGEDPCNSSGNKNKKILQTMYNTLEYTLEKIAGTKPLYLYKERNGLDKHNGIINWLEDPEHIIEKIFFKHHFPCESFVIISKNGNYKSYLGEFPNEMILEFAEQLLKQD